MISKNWNLSLTKLRKRISWERWGKKVWINKWNCLSSRLFKKILNAWHPNAHFVMSSISQDILVHVLFFTPGYVSYLAIDGIWKLHEIYCYRWDRNTTCEFMNETCDFMKELCLLYLTFGFTVIQGKHFVKLHCIFFCFFTSLLFLFLWLLITIFCIIYRNSPF